jgi:acetyl esterase/lipase
MTLPPSAARLLLPSALLLLAVPPATADAPKQTLAEARKCILWPEGAPGAVGKEPGDTPSVTVYLPPAGKATGAAVVICPGGGYGFLAMDHEGHQVARWLNTLGVAGVILQYRIAPRYHHPAPLQDAQRALRYTRAHAKEWGIDPHKVGILGFSAGGHLASTAATHFDDGRLDAPDPIDRLGCRPDFAILVYAVITFGEHTHVGSRNNLLGKEAGDARLREELSNEKQVTARTPPTFLVHTSEDTAVPPENSVLFYLALHRARVPAELHIFEKGAHGLGLGRPGTPFARWPQLCAAWLRERHVLGKQ